MAKVLIGCEESQSVCITFRELGHEAYSCDILSCSGNHPEWHLQMDVFKAITGGELNTQSGSKINIDTWDLAIFHPECTRLTVAANKYYNPEYSERFPNIHLERRQAIDFFIKLTKTGIKRVAIENPIGIMSSKYKKPNQVIQPWWFGDPERKATCLWLYNLPALEKTNPVNPEIIYHKSGKTDSKLHFETLRLPKEERRRIRSKTFSGIAKAMADQWGKLL